MGKGPGVFYFLVFDSASYSGVTCNVPVESVTINPHVQVEDADGASVRWGEGSSSNTSISLSLLCRALDGRP